MIRLDVMIIYVLLNVNDSDEILTLSASLTRLNYNSIRIMLVREYDYFLIDPLIVWLLDFSDSSDIMIMCFQSKKKSQWQNNEDEKYMYNIDWRCHNEV